MKKHIRVILLTCGLILAFSIISCVILFTNHKGATLTISNQSAHRMDGVTIELMGYGKREVGVIEPGKKVRVNFQGYSDSAWFIDFDNYSDERTRKGFGYVTHGLNFDDRITVDSSGLIDFQSTSWSIFPPIKSILGL